MDDPPPAYPPPSRKMLLDLLELIQIWVTISPGIPSSFFFLLFLSFWPLRNDAKKGGEACRDVALAWRGRGRISTAAKERVNFLPSHHGLLNIESFALQDRLRELHLSGVHFWRAAASQT